MAMKSRRKGTFLSAYKLEDRDLQRADKKSFVNFGSTKCVTFTD
jgi:hypothetical protein